VYLKFCNRMAFPAVNICHYLQTNI
jgi:hypothetical protein